MHNGGRILDMPLAIFRESYTHTHTSHFHIETHIPNKIYMQTIKNLNRHNHGGPYAFHTSASTCWTLLGEFFGFYSTTWAHNMCAIPYPFGRRTTTHFYSIFAMHVLHSLSLYLPIPSLFDDSGPTMSDFSFLRVFFTMLCANCCSTRCAYMVGWLRCLPRSQFTKVALGRGLPGYEWSGQSYRRRRAYICIWLWGRGRAWTVSRLNGFAKRSIAMIGTQQWGFVWCVLKLKGSIKYKWSVRE